MRENVLIVFFCFIFISIISQNRKNIDGNIVIDKIALSDVHIINKSTNIGTVSNDKGFFEITVKLNDSLFISHLNYNEVFIVITDRHISSQKINIELEERVETLNGITLGNKKSIFHIDKDILIYNPKVTAKSLNLPYAESKKEENKSVIRIRSGAVVSLDNLINVLNGNKKRAQIIKQLSTEDKELNKIRAHFTDDFFVTNLKIKKDFINQFLEFCKNEEIINDFKSKNQIDFMAIIIRHSKKFLYKVESDDLYLSKN